MSISATPPVTFGNFTGIDFSQIIQAETAAAQIPIGQLNGEITGEQTQITSLGAIGANLSLLQSNLSNLNRDVTTPQQAINVQTGAPFTASTSGSPASGVYTVTVNRLASSQISASQGYASDTDVVGSGTFTITLGGVAHQISLASSTSTLDDLAGAINSAAIGVTATVVNTGLPGAPYRLELASNATGAANAFTVSSNLSGGVTPDFNNSAIGPVALDAVTGSALPAVSGSYTGSLSQSYHFTVTSGGTIGTDPITIAYSSDSGETGTITLPANYNAGDQVMVADGLNLSLGSGTLNAGDRFSVAAFTPALASAADAQVQVGNQIVSSATNTVTNAIPGANLNLQTTGGPSIVTVSQNVSGESADVNAFVNTFNTLLSAVTGMTQAVPGQPAPSLANNGGLEAMLENMRESLGTIDLSTLGVSIDNKTGQLQFDSTGFLSNSASNPSGVATAITGIYNALNPQVGSVLAPQTGLIASATTALQNEIDDQNTKITQLQSQITQQTTALTAQYAQLQAQILQYQNIQLLLQEQDASGSSSGSTVSTPPVGSNLTVNS